MKVGYTGHKQYSVLGRTGKSISFITDIAPGANLAVRPPINEEWRIRHFAAEMWTIAGAPADVPNITVSLKNGADLSDILQAGIWSVGFFINPFIDIDYNTYLNINNADAANNEVAVIGYVTRQF